MCIFERQNLDFYVRQCWMCYTSNKIANERISWLRSNDFNALQQWTCKAISE